MSSEIPGARISWFDGSIAPGVARRLVDSIKCEHPKPEKPEPKGLRQVAAMRDILADLPLGGVHSIASKQALNTELTSGIRPHRDGRKFRSLSVVCGEYYTPSPLGFSIYIVGRMRSHGVRGAEKNRLI
jgi:hypothetical protein